MNTVNNMLKSIKMDAFVVTSSLTKKGLLLVRLMYLAVFVFYFVLVGGLLQTKAELIDEGIDIDNFRSTYTEELKSLEIKYIEASKSEMESVEVEFISTRGTMLVYKEDGIKKEAELELEWGNNVIMNNKLYTVMEQGDKTELYEIKQGETVKLYKYDLAIDTYRLNKVNGKVTVDKRVTE